MFTVLLTVLATVFAVVKTAFKAAWRGTRRAFRKLNRQREKHSLLFTLSLSVIGLFLVGYTVWFMFDDGMLYWMLLADKKQAGGAIGSQLPSNWYDSPYSGSSGSGTTVPYGVTGVQGMYISSMNAGYYKEMLEIVRDTASGKLIQDEFFAAYPGMFPNGRADYTSTPMIVLLGTHLAETGVSTEDKFSPNWFFQPSQWDTSTGMTLSNYNSKYINEKGITSFSNGWTIEGKKKNDYFGPYQFSLGWWFNRPSGKIVVSEPTNASFFPSTMNGHGESGRRLGRWESPWPGNDIMYYPDNVAMAVQYSCYNFCGQGKNPYPKDLQGSAKALALYAMHGGGEGTWKRYCRNSTKGTTAEKLKVVYAGWNHVASILDKSVEYCVTHGDDVGVSWFTQYTWEGWASMALLLNGGMFRSSADLSGYKNMYNSQAAAQKGALLAYRFYKGNDSATNADVKNFINSLTVTNLDVGLYGDVPDTTKEYDMYIIDPNTKALREDGQDVQSIAMWNSQALFGGPAALIEGPRSYWKMLNASGVECTLADATKDLNGSRVVYPGSKGEADANWGATVPVGDNPEGSYYWGTRKPASYVPGSATLSAATSCMYWRELKISTGIHFGEDFSYGKDLAAIMEGNVIKVGYDPGWGNYAKIQVDKPASGGEDEPKMVYLYAHMKKVYVSEGDHVKEGDLIGHAGSTGNSTGVHLHLEFWVYNSFIKGGLRACISFRSVFEELYTIAAAPRVRRKDSGAKMDKEACIVYDGVGNELGLLSSVNAKNTPQYCNHTPLESAGLNYFMKQALQNYALVYGSKGPPATAIDKIIATARSKIGIKYGWGEESDEKGYDCSGLTWYCFKQVGIKLTRQARYQRRETVQVSFDELKPGDLFFFHKNKIDFYAESKEAGMAHHVGIVISKNGPNPSDLIVIDSNEWSGSGGASQNGVLEAAITRQIGRNAKVSDNRLCIEYTLSDGANHFVTFGRYIGDTD